MKFATLAAFLTALAEAQRTTTNNCFDEQQVVKASDCKSLFFKMCEEFTIEPKGSCNVQVYSDSAIMWYSSSLQVVYWQYQTDKDAQIVTDKQQKEDLIKQADADAKSSADPNSDFSETSDPFGDFGDYGEETPATGAAVDEETDENEKANANGDDEQACVESSPIPFTYQAAQKKSIIPGICGYKFQIINEHEEASFTFQVLRNGSYNALSATAAVSAFLASVALF